jgi:hypothetical protein
MTLECRFLRERRMSITRKGGIVPEEGFKLPGSSYEELVKIIRAYENVGGDASPADVGKLIGMHETIVSRNNGFLLGIGVIQGGRKKAISEKGKELARALDHEMPDEITRGWRLIVTESDFLQKIVSAVRIRKGMEPATLQSHVAYSAGQRKTPTAMTGAGAVVDILRAAGALEEAEGKLVVAEKRPPLEEPLAEEEEEEELADVPRIRRRVFEDVDASGGRPSIRVDIQIQIQCGADEVKDLAPKIRTLIDEVSKPASGEIGKVDE